MNDTPHRDPRRILYLVTEDWSFMTHRVPLARACRDNGWDVCVAANVDTAADAIRGEGFRLHAIRLNRGSMNPFCALISIFDLYCVLKLERPDVVHLSGLKMVLLGLAAAMFAPSLKFAIAAAPTGMGFLYTNRRPLLAPLRAAIRWFLRMTLKKPNRRVIVQNDDDAALFAGPIVDSDKVSVIRGAGVDLAQYTPSLEPDGTPVVAVISRMLKDKGIVEMAEAARLLKERGVDVRIWLVGPPDAENPTSIDEVTLRGWQDEGVLEWKGSQTDIAALWRDAHIAALPSYREGMPKALLEAAASGRPIVTTDTTGCRDVVEDGVSGLIVPVGDAVALADAIEKLAGSKELRTQMGIQARARTEAMFGLARIVDETQAVYGDLLGGSG